MYNLSSRCGDTGNFSCSRPYILSVGPNEGLSLWAGVVVKSLRQALAGWEGKSSHYLTPLLFFENELNLFAAFFFESIYDDRFDYVGDANK